MRGVPQIGETYNVSWTSSSGSDKAYKLAEVLDRRPTVEKRDSDVDSLPAGSVEYYVHYLGVDRRMDEWVGFKRMKKVKEAGRGRNSKTGDRLTHQQQESAAQLKRKLGRSDADWGAGTKRVHTHDADHDDHITRVKNIQSIQLGEYNIAAWYYSPYPQDVCSNVEEKLFICEYCLAYMNKQSSLARHKAKCKMRSPPGKEIYRDKELSCFEVDGKDHKIYCQNLCLLSKLFLDHKTLYYDVDPFLFYILCEADADGCHVVGYFSKEKNSAENYNLSCILTYPPYQRKGYGKFLISLSYEMTKREKTTGSPEKPISDLGLITYKSYWSHVLLEALTKRGLKQASINDLSEATGICEEDVVSTLQDLNLLTHWKGQTFLTLSKAAVGAAKCARVRLADPAQLHWKGPPETSK